MDDIAGDLRDAVDDLVNERSVEIRPGAYVRLPPLLDQLAEAAEPSSGVTGTKSPYRSPAHLDVLTLLADIDSTVNTGLRMFGVHDRFEAQPRSARVSMWAAKTARWQRANLAYYDQAVSTVRRWVARGDAILTPDPQTVETRAQPCPHCGRATAMVWSDEHGERVQRSALYLDKQAMVVYCRCCHAEWGSSLWGLLCKILEGR